jgi:hypothetical protein
VRRRLALLLALTLAPGCGASLARLERGHHYDEAICGAREQAFPEGQVAAMVRRALDPAIHVAVVPRERTAELVEHALVRVTYDSNTIPLQGFDAAFNLVRAGSSRRLDGVDLPQLAFLMSERTPSPVVVGGSGSGSGLGSGLVEAGRAIGTVGALIFHVSTLGIFSGIFGRGGGRSSSSSSSSGPTTIYPTTEQLRKAAPRAAALYDSVAHLDDRHCGDDPGKTCHVLGLVDAPALEQGELVLEIDLHYSSRCDWSGIHDHLELPLPPGPTLEARVHAVFGDRMRRLSELPVRPHG